MSHKQNNNTNNVHNNSNSNSNKNVSKNNANKNNVNKDRNISLNRNSKCTNDIIKSGKKKLDNTSIYATKLYAHRFIKSDLVKFSIFVMFVIISIGIIIYFFPFFLSLQDSSVRMLWIDKIKNQGFAGILTAIGIQIFQVVFAVIPGEPIEIAMGYLYGTFGGLAVCLFGIFIGSLIILYIVKLLGVSFVSKLIKKETMAKLNFLHNTKSLETVVFIMFLIPGTPKDLLTYFVPLTSMKPFRFLLIATFARIPSVITSTLVGASLGSNKWGLSIFVFILTAIIGIIGIQLNNWYMKKHHALENQK